MSLRIVLLSLPLALVACTRPDSLYCDESTPCTDPARPFCDLTGEFPAASGVARTCIADPNTVGQPDGGGVPPDATVDCTESTQCSSSLPICRNETCEACVLGATGNGECAARDADFGICAADGTCVECASNTDCSETGSPICDTETGSCGACSEHIQCDSGACEFETGACIDDADIIYVDSSNGTDNATCGSAPGTSACQHLGRPQGGIAKVSASRNTIVMAPGNYAENVSIGATTAHIIGNGARLFPPGFIPGAPLSLSSGADIIIDDLSIESGNAVGAGVGVNCLSASLKLTGVTIKDNDDAGITAEDCSLRLTDTEVSDNGQEGIQLRTGSTLTMRDSAVVGNGFHGLHMRSSAIDIRRSRIMGNVTGGVYIFSSTFVLENNFIAQNGNLTVAPGNPTGGVVIETVPGPPISPQEIRHNTIADNLAPAVVASAGLVCNTGAGTGTVQCDSNIVVGNERPGDDLQTSGSCGIRYSNVTGITSGEGNVSANPIFVSTSTGDYHLAAGSPGIDIADPASTANDDIDGEARPNGAGFDMGADER